MKRDALKVEVKPASPASNPRIPCHRPSHRTPSLPALPAKSSNEPSLSTRKSRRKCAPNTWNLTGPLTTTASNPTILLQRSAKRPRQTLRTRQARRTRHRSSASVALRIRAVSSATRFTFKKQEDTQRNKKQKGRETSFLFDMFYK